MVNLSEFSLFRLYRENNQTIDIKESLKNLYQSQFKIKEEVKSTGKIDTDTQLNHTFDMLLYNKKEIVGLDISSVNPNERHFQGANFILEQIKEEMKVPNMRYLLYNLFNKQWETMDYKGKDWIISHIRKEFLDKIPSSSDTTTAAE